MANVMQSLFGLTMPQQPVASDPLQAYSGLISGTGSSLQQNIAGAFNQQTPQQALNSIIQQTQQQADLSTPEGLTQLANNLNQLPQFSGIALAMRQEAAKLSQEQTKLSYEMAAKAASAQKDIAQAGQAEAGRASDRMNTRFVDLATRERTTGLNKTEKAEYESLRELMTIKSPKGQTIDLGGAFNKAFSVADAKEKADAWNKAGAAYTTAIPILNQIDKVESIVPNAFTGKFAEGKLGLSKALGAIGIPISDKAPDTEYINAISAKLVQQIARAFPGSLAVKELDQLVKSKPNIAQESGTILRLLGDIRDEIQSQTTTYEQLSKIDKTKRYEQDPNVLQGQNYNKIRRYREIKTRALAGSATKDEALEAQRIQQELGLK